MANCSECKRTIDCAVRPPCPRDEFIAAALTGYLAAGRDTFEALKFAADKGDCKPTDQGLKELLGRWCVEMADATMKAREQSGD